MPKQSRTVSLNVNNTPPVTIAGGDIILTMGETDDLEWTPAQGQAGWSFSNITLSDKTSALPNPPFSDIDVNDNKIKIKDTNTSSVDVGQWGYSICVTQGNSTYWSDPEIINKPGN
jgi:hypothetical protein